MRSALWALAGTGLSACFLLSSCSAPAHEPTERYVLVATNIKLPYWQNAAAGLNHAGSELKVKTEMVGPDTYDVKGEASEFHRVLGQNPSGILVSAADASQLTPEIDAAAAKGVPVLTVDSDAPDSKRLFFVGTENYNAGLLGGRLAAKMLDGKGNVVIFTIPTQQNLKDRMHGYEDALAEKSGIKVVQVVDIKGDPTVAFDTTKQILAGKTKVDAFICLEAIACPEVGEVVNRENMGGKVKIIAMDTDSRTLDLLQKGVISATIAQKPWTMGYYGAKLLDDAHHNKPSLDTKWADNARSPVPRFVDTGAFIVDKSNVSGLMDQAAAK